MTEVTKGRDRISEKAALAKLSSAKDRIYVIGDKGVGIFLIKMNPTRIVRIPDAEVRRYGKANNCDGYAAVAGLCWRLIADHRAAEGVGAKVEKESVAAIASMAEAGAHLSNLMFSFGTSMSVTSIQSIRGFNLDLKMALCYLTQRTGSDLQDAVLLDDGNRADFSC